MKKDLIILAAGKGTRLAPLTLHTPKCLIIVNSKPILHHILNNLPLDKVNNIIIILGYHGQVIKDYIEYNFQNLKVSFAYQSADETGTYGALHSAKNLIQTKSFVVMNSDDIYSREDLNKLFNSEMSMGIVEKLLPMPNLIVEINNGKAISFRKPDDDELTTPKYIASGAYVLDESFWDLDSVNVKNSTEKSLPRTLEKQMRQGLVNSLILSSWVGINTYEELLAAEHKLKGYILK